MSAFPASGRPIRLAGVALAVLLASAPVAAQRPGPAGGPVRPAITLVVSDILETSGFVAYFRTLLARQRRPAARLVTRPTGQALAMAERGEADALLVDDFEGERRLVASGHASERYDVMYGHLIVVGPEDDPAGIGGMTSVIDALRLLASAETPFISRGDDSGVARAERRYWEEAGIDVAGGSLDWYEVTRADMRATLERAAARRAYALADRGSWLAWGGTERLPALVTGDPRFIHQFGLVLVAAARHPGVNASAARVFLRWLGTAAARRAIGRYAIAGELPYTPNFGRHVEEAPDSPRASRSETRRATRKKRR